jgi:hypothetical protein
MRADVVPESLNEEARTVDVVWTTGARVKRFDWFDGPFWEELDTSPKSVRMERLKSGRAPVFLQHNSYNPNAHQGVVVKASIKGGEGTATLRFLTGDADADKTWNKIRQGVLTSVSVGYAIHRVQETKGTDGALPVRRAVDWEPFEISPVAMPADPGAHIRSDVRTTNPCEFITRGEAPQKETKMADETNPPAPAPANPTPDADHQRAVAAERERTAAITTLARRHGMSPEMTDKLIADGSTLDAARTAVLNEMVTRSDAQPIQGNHRIEAGDDARDKFQRGAEAWLIQRSGHAKTILRAVEAGRTAAFEKDPGEFRGMTLLGLARESLERVGVSTRRMNDARIAELALMKRAGPGLATASDFPVLLENVTNKVLLGAYEVTPHEWNRFCGQGSVSNFHEHNRYRKGAFGTLDAVNDHGELKNKAIPDGEKRAVSVGTYGNTLGITRKTLIQDDMGVFTDLAGAFGAAAMNTVEAAVWALVKANSGLGANYDANPLFHSSRANINTTASGLTAAGLDADSVIMARQAAPSGTTTLNLVPAILIVAREYKMQAAIINGDAFDPDASTKQGKTNPARGMFRDIVASAQLTGPRRYLFADPAVAPVIEVTFLQGQEAPQMESQEGFEVLGLQWRIFLDFGVNLVDYRGSVTNAGS